MAYRKTTLRRASPKLRKLLEALNDIERGTRAIKRLLPEIERWESDAEAMSNYTLTLDRMVQELADNDIGPCPTHGYAAKKNCTGCQRWVEAWRKAGLAKAVRG